jgi:hypothetical protein
VDTENYLAENCGMKIFTVFGYHCERGVDGEIVAVFNSWSYYTAENKPE